MGQATGDASFPLHLQGLHKVLPAPAVLADNIRKLVKTTEKEQGKVQSETFGYVQRVVCLAL